MLDAISQIDWGDFPTWAAALIAAPSVFLAAVQVRSAAKQEEDSLRPVVIATVEETPEKWQNLDFCVRNVGRGPAYDVQIEFDEKPEVSSNLKGWEFWKANFIVSEIPVLSSFKEYRTYVDSSTAREKSSTPLKSTGSGTIKYRSVNGREFEEPFSFDLDLMRNSSRVTVYGIDEQVKTLKKIQERLEQGISATIKPSL